jgi:hypothetical protein
VLKIGDYVALSSDVRLEMSDCPGCLGVIYMIENTDIYIKWLMGCRVYRVKRPYKSQSPWLATELILLDDYDLTLRLIAGV